MPGTIRRKRTPPGLRLPFAIVCGVLVPGVCSCDRAAPDATPDVKQTGDQEGSLTTAEPEPDNSGQVADSDAGDAASAQTASNVSGDSPGKAAADPPGPVPVDVETDWTSLFDGETLDGWELSTFLGQADVTVEDGALILGRGSDLTGVRTERPLPRIDYEVELEAQRVDGSDFFCGLTFPVRDDPCSLIIGGWGGGVCGLSSIDGMDASENETISYHTFETGRWYAVRLRVTGERIEAWLDDRKIVNLPIAGRGISIRSEVEPSKPFGLASWRTTAALRNIRIRKLAAGPSTFPSDAGDAGRAP